MYSENMSGQDWRIACLMQQNANYVRKQKEEADQSRHNALLQQQKNAAFLQQQALNKQVDAAREAANTAAKAVEAQQLANKIQKEHNQLLRIENEWKNQKELILQTIPLLRENEVEEYIISQISTKLKCAKVRLKTFFKIFHFEREITQLIQTNCQFIDDHNNLIKNREILQNQLEAEIIKENKAKINLEKKYILIENFKKIEEIKNKWQPILLKIWGGLIAVFFLALITNSVKLFALFALSIFPCMLISLVPFLKNLKQFAGRYNATGLLPETVKQLQQAHLRVYIPLLAIETIQNTNSVAEKNDLDICEKEVFRIAKEINLTANFLDLSGKDYREYWVESIILKASKSDYFEKISHQSVEQLIKLLFNSEGLEKELEAIQSFLPPRYKVSLEKWKIHFKDKADSFLINFKSDLVGFIDFYFADFLRRAWDLKIDKAPYSYLEIKQVRSPSVFESEILLEDIKWDLFCYSNECIIPIKEISYLTVILSLWNDDEISPNELYQSMATIRCISLNIDHDTSYELILESVKLYEQDRKTKNTVALTNAFLAIQKMSLFRKKILFKQLEKLSCIDSPITDRQQQVLDLLKGSQQENILERKSFFNTASMINLKEGELYNVVLLLCKKHNKVECIKKLREIDQMIGLKEAADLVNVTPSVLLKNIDKATAENAKNLLEKIGVIIEIKNC